MFFTQQNVGKNNNLFLFVLLLGARVAQYCGRCVHTKVTSHPAWGKADNLSVLFNISKQLSLESLTNHIVQCVSLSYPFYFQQRGIYQKR